jgi:hypothetical protein
VRKIHKHVVIGTGMSALGTILALYKKRKSILIVDSAKKFYFNDNEVIFCDQKLPLVKVLNWKKINIRNLLKIKAFGGHSNIWGGSCLRLFDNEFYDWPLKYNEIKKYYEICEKILNLENLRINTRTKFFNKKLNKIFYIDKAKIAKESKYKNNIFSTKKIINKILKSKNVSYYSGDVKKICNEKNEKYLKFNNSNEKIYFKNLFIGAGAINSSKILANSLSKIKILKVKQSQSFFVPAIMSKNLNYLKEKSSHQIVIKKFFSKKRNFYLELKHNPEYLRKTLLKKYGFFGYLLPDFILNRFIIVSGFLPSDYSVDFYKENLSSSTINKINKIKIDLKNLFKELEVFFSMKILNIFIKFTQFGRSFHIGGNIPMNEDLNQIYLKTDKYGAIIHKNMKNVYVIDSSIFPHIPSCAMGLTSMANAYRIVDKKIK